MKKLKCRKSMIVLIATCITCFMLSITSFVAKAAEMTKVTFSDSGISEEYVTNAVFSTPKVTANVGDNSYETDCTIVFPNGNTCYSDTFILNETGVYKVIYTATINGKTYVNKKEFVVKDTSENLFTVNKADVWFGEADFFEKTSGMQVSGEVGTTVTYNKVINLSQNTKDETLIDLLALANKVNNEDFSQFLITLTDVYDENNFVTIKVHSAKTNSRYSSYVQAKAPGQRFCGLENGNPNFGITAGGLVIAHSFGSVYPVNEKNSEHRVILSYDNSERAIYALKDDRYQLAVDLDDEKYITNPWKGFTTGEVIMSIAIGDVVGSPKYLIKEIDGNKFNADIPEDEKAPKVICDMPENIPSAVVGKKYPIFNAKAWDNYALKSFTTKVYYRYDSGNRVSVSVVDGYFIPNKTGAYTIVYEAVDFAGRKTVKTVQVIAYDATDIDALQMTLNSTESEQREIGENIALRDYEFSGGVGNDTVCIEVKKDGQTVQQISSASFNIYEVGEYKVVYSVTDYVGNVASAEYTLTIVENTKPLILDNIVLPKAFVNNLAYELPQVCAFDYTGGIENEIKPTISATIDGKAQNVVGTIVTPTAENDGDLMTVTYKYVNGNGVETVWNKDVPVINVKTQVGAIDQTKYFISNGFAVESLSDSISLTTSAGNAEATFVRPVQARNLVLGVGFLTDGFNAEYFDVIISDKFNESETLKIRVFGNGMVSLNDGEKSSINYANGAKTIFTFNYDNATRAFSDSLANVFAKATSTVDGNEFNGFTSDEVFVTVKLGANVDKSTLYVTLINNQTITKSGRDNILPQIYLNDLLGGRHNPGDTATIYRAYAYDVLNSIESLTVTVTNLDLDEIVKDVNGVLLDGVSADKDYQVKLQNYGRYQVSYTAKDLAGKNITATKVINVFDDQAPTISVKGEMPKTATLNNPLVVPKFDVSDAQTEITTFYYVAVAPNGETTYFVSQFTPDQIGEWIIWCFAMDKNGQMSVKEFIVTVA